MLISMLVTDAKINTFLGTKFAYVLLLLLFIIILMCFDLLGCFFIDRLCAYYRVYQLFIVIQIKQFDKHSTEYFQT